MGIDVGPIEVVDGLVFHIDAGNTRSYTGTGLTSNGLVGGIGGTLLNGTGFSSANGGSFFFDGTNDYMIVNHTQTSLLQYSVSMWIKFSGNGAFFNNRGLTGTNGVSYTLRLVGGNLAYVPVDSDGIIAEVVTSGINFTDNTWRHLVTTMDVPNGVTLSSVNYTSYLKCYVNGQEKTLSNSQFSNVPAHPTTGRESLQLGRSYAWGTYITGNIANIQVYQAKLTSNQVFQNYNATKGRYK